MELIWSDFAKADYWENIDYLLEEWTKKDALHFIKKVDDDLLDLFPKAQEARVGDAILELFKRRENIDIFKK